jgi:hypothetical protein
MILPLRYIISHPYQGRRLTAKQHEAVLAAAVALEVDRDMDTAIGVLLGISALINRGRGIAEQNTIEHSVRIAREVARCWCPRA